MIDKAECTARGRCLRELNTLVSKYGFFISKTGGESVLRTKYKEDEHKNGRLVRFGRYYSGWWGQCV